MRRIAILTAGGDTPALNATVFGAATACNHHDIELLGLIGGYRSLFDNRVPHVTLNPSFSTIPELDPTRGGTIIGSSRHYVDVNDDASIKQASENLAKVGIEGLICVGGDGTINAMQALSDRLPVILAPKTIDNDLGLNYEGENTKYTTAGTIIDGRDVIAPSEMINYVTPGYATAVFVAANGLSRIRTTAESHSRIAIVEVMGRHSGFIALGTSYGQPDLVLLPESPICPERLSERVREIYSRQKHAVIVCGEGVVDANGQVIGDAVASTDPAGNQLLSGAAEGIKRLLSDSIGDKFFHDTGGLDGANRAIFTRKVGHTQRGGRPIQFDRFYAAQLGNRAVKLLQEGRTNTLSTIQYDHLSGFTIGDLEANNLRDNDGMIHARNVHACFYDEQAMQIAKPGIDYLLPIFSDAISDSDVEAIRQTVFDSGNLYHRYQSIQERIEQRIELI